MRLLRHLPMAALLAAFLLPGPPARADVVTRLPDGGPAGGKMVALTFDACESTTPAFFDHKILDYLVAEKIPATIFVTGKFARHNAEELKRIAALDFIEIENHSLTHPQHMEKLAPDALLREVDENDRVLEQITGHRPALFRFPAGNYDAKTLEAVEKSGHKVVHWSFASGDPAKSVTPAHLSQWVLSQTRPGSILIFHINGRGYATGAALPGLLADLKKRGYQFVRLDAMIR